MIRYPNFFQELAEGLDDQAAKPGVNGVGNPKMMFTFRASNGCFQK